MSATWTPDAVQRIAALAHLELDDREIALYGRQLADILHYAEQVQEVNTAGIPPTVHPLGSGASGRDDAPAPSLERAEVLRGAPDAAPDAGLFRVPKVL
jgi:aspartyl-tRNA(Asn)/glutamyl-tRNA(Gln) amidotransferase subunit C